MQLFRPTHITTPVHVLGLLLRQRRDILPPRDQVHPADILAQTRHAVRVGLVLPPRGGGFGPLGGGDKWVCSVWISSGPPRTEHCLCSNSNGHSRIPSQGHFGRTGTKTRRWNVGELVAGWDEGVTVLGAKTKQSRGRRRRRWREFIWALALPMATTWCTWRSHF